MIRCRDGGGRRRGRPGRGEGAVSTSAPDWARDSAGCSGPPGMAGGGVGGGSCAPATRWGSCSPVPWAALHSPFLPLSAGPGPAWMGRHPPRRRHYRGKGGRGLRRCRPVRGCCSSDALEKGRPPRLARSRLDGPRPGLQTAGGSWAAARLLPSPLRLGACASCSAPAVITRGPSPDHCRPFPDEPETLRRARVEHVRP